ncbi:RNA pseudouridylate synthase family protein [Pseudooceanicola batsensis HTCC2597]|uniref:Pseudouridine synthase n=1 Tax=Pseudooceanicola batsensis (strain ATCC BAA-863 / DSM 15984 / KCTC 12145 / HTCC2597) TaxID=252305 RepID=A3TYQ5_PSEBH|nr:pseudouridine synthase [Pseudooceanicola batsensis]EAQ02723.1 RNA pseudouridylate synthase family protein [Pseudooceanicola batsensis HTCC2597]
MSKPPEKPPAGDRIAKVLARAGVASRREAERMIAEGRISVDGTVIDSPALNVTARARIEVDGRPLDAPEPARLWLYHKPPGLVTTHKDDQGRPTIFDDLPEDMPRVMSVGRLDLNSEGLLLLTNDGGIKRRLELPSTGWLRRYRVRVKGTPTDATLAPLREGVVVDREIFQPMQVTLDRQQGANAWLTVGLREGKNREIRRAMESIGLSVNRLIRISYGPFQLGPLAPGAVEEVRRRVMRDQLGLDDAEADAPRPKRSRAGQRTGPETKTRDKVRARTGGKTSGGGRTPDAPVPEAPWETRPKPRGKPPGPDGSGKARPRPHVTRRRRKKD